MTQKLEQHTSRKHNLFTFKPQVFFVIQRARGKEGSVHFLVLFAFGEGDWFLLGDLFCYCFFVSFEELQPQLKKKSSCIIWIWLDWIVLKQ